VLYGIYVFSSLLGWVAYFPWLSSIFLLASGISLVAFAFGVRQRGESEVAA
jgi:hypothetical protein